MNVDHPIIPGGLELYVRLMARRLESSRIDSGHHFQYSIIDIDVSDVLLTVSSGMKARRVA